MASDKPVLFTESDAARIAAVVKEFTPPNSGDRYRGGQRGRYSPPLMFPVKVTQNGGAAGTGTTACTFTYDVFNWNGDTKIISGVETPVKYGSKLAVQFARPLGMMTAALNGWGFFLGEVFVLLQVDEIPATHICT